MTMSYSWIEIPHNKHLGNCNIFKLQADSDFL